MKKDEAICSIIKAVGVAEALNTFLELPLLNQLGTTICIVIIWRYFIKDLLYLKQTPAADNSDTINDEPKKKDLPCNEQVRYQNRQDTLD